MPGIIIIALALFFGKITGIFRRIPNQRTVIGEIVSMEYKYFPNESRSSYIAHVEYVLDGTSYCVESKFRSSKFHTGQRMRVAYNSQKPEMAIICPVFSDYLVFIVLMISGIIVSYITFTK